MANYNLRNKYFVKRSSSGAWEDVTTRFNGLKILSIDGFNEVGDALNVYTEQWVDSSVEDFMITNTNGHEASTIVRKNVDLSLTFICGERYGAQNTQSVHDAFINYVCNGTDFYIKSAYTGKAAHVVCLSAYKPTTQKLQRGNNSYIMGTIELHCLQPPYQA